MSYEFGTEHAKNFDVLLESRLYFIQHINYKPSQAPEFLGLIHFVTNHFSLDILKILHVSLIKSKFQRTSAVWNNLTLKERNKFTNVVPQVINVYDFI
jgi:hypothetical protein